MSLSGLIYKAESCDKYEQNIVNSFETEYIKKLTGHCIWMLTDEPANRFVIYESKIRSSPRQGRHISIKLRLPGEKTL